LHRKGVFCVLFFEGILSQCAPRKKRDRGRVVRETLASEIKR
jgi:hypothetical protein